MKLPKDAYDTSTGGVIATKNIKEAISKGMILDQIEKTTLDIKPADIDTTKGFFISGIHPSEENIPIFYHPIHIMDRKNITYVISDIRSFFNSKDYDGNLHNLPLVIRNKTEYKFNKLRTILNMLWLDQTPSSLLINIPFTTYVFTKWINDALVRTYAVEPRDQFIISVVCHHYYMSLFYNSEDIDETVIDMFKMITIKNNMISEDIVNEVYEKIKPIESVNTLIENIIHCTDSIKFKNSQFSLIVLLTILKNSWFGSNSEKIIPNALEFPPTWIAMVYLAVNENTYKNSNLSKIIEKYVKKQGGLEFVIYVKKAIKDYQYSESHLTMLSHGFKEVLT